MVHDTRSHPICRCLHPHTVFFLDNNSVHVLFPAGSVTLSSGTQGTNFGVVIVWFINSLVSQTVEVFPHTPFSSRLMALTYSVLSVLLPTVNELPRTRIGPVIVGFMFSAVSQIVDFPPHRFLFFFFFCRWR